MPNGFTIQTLDAGGTVIDTKDYTESVAGSGNPDTLITGIITKSPARKGISQKKKYTREAKRTFVPGQFGSGLYFDPKYRFSVDFNPGPKTVAERKNDGISLFNVWAISEAEKASLSPADGMYYITESAFHNNGWEGASYFERTIADYEQQIVQFTPACGVNGPDKFCGILIFNIENSNSWERVKYDNPPHWTSWDSHKNNTVQLESDSAKSTFPSGYATVEQLHNANLLEIEGHTRRSNRLTLLFQVVRNKSAAGTKIIYGSSNQQGPPRTNQIGDPSQFMAFAGANVKHVGGDNSGNITLNGRSYTLTGNQYDKEDAMLGYFYHYRFDISQQDFSEIWEQRLPGTQTYEYLWGKMHPVHIVAEEKGYLQLCRQKMMQNQGVKRGIIRMIEPVYEPDAPCHINGIPRPVRAPFADLYNSIQIGDFIETPKVWLQPYRSYSIYAVGRFLHGADFPLAGIYIFPTSNIFVRGDLNSHEWRLYNHHLHFYTALYQARFDMQPLEKFFPGSTLVEDPEVKINGVGNWESYTGVVAYNDAYNSSSSAGQKPAYIMRYKSTPFGYTVWILGGMNQGWNDTRTDLVRATGGLLSGNQFEVKLIGPEAQWYEFAVQNGDSNQTYQALPIVVEGERKPGYAGRVINS
ncbi:hypothetical protein GCM10028807_32530 [Spirosoma daeguense]